jgi:hypothetical protein
VDGISTREVWADWDRAGGDQELVIWLPCFSVAFKITNKHLSPCRIDLFHFMQHSYIDFIVLPKLIRSTDNELFFCIDYPADVIRDTSSGIGSMWASLKDDYV